MIRPLVTISLVSLLAACGQSGASDGSGENEAGAPLSRLDFAATDSCDPLSSAPIQLKGGSFVMGQAGVYAEEGPERKTQVDGFWIDPHEVSNRQFAEFVKATGYLTIAEKPVDPEVFGVPLEQIPASMLEPGSAMFTPPQKPSSNYVDWWEYVPGASWQKPYGPDGPDAQSDQPVVHLGWEDMKAYADWAGGRIPSEAEWEFAASAGAGKYTEQPDPAKANSWQGVFPMINEADDGFKGIAPVGCFDPNGFGLYDMVGNVWEMTSDFYRPGHDPAQQVNPKGPSENAAYDPVNPGLLTRVIKGGSYLCAPNYCQRYRPTSRHGRDPGLGASNVGFRLVYDAAPKG